MSIYQVIFISFCTVFASAMAALGVISVAWKLASRKK